MTGTVYEDPLSSLVYFLLKDTMVKHNFINDFSVLFLSCKSDPVQTLLLSVFYTRTTYIYKSNELKRSSIV